MEPEAKLCLPLAQKIFHDFAGEFDCAIATWKGSGKKFFESIASQLDIPTESEPDENGKTKALTMDGLKEAIADGINPEQTLLIFPEAKRLTTGVRYWLEDLIDTGLTIVAIAVTNPAKDIFLNLIEIEIANPTEVKIREIMRNEAERYGLSLSNAEISALLPQAGRSAIVAKQVIRRRALGIESETAQHTQYINVTPLWFAFLARFGAMKFIGMGTERKDWQIFGGLAFMLFMSLKQLGQIRGTKRRIGQ